MNQTTPGESFLRLPGQLLVNDKYKPLSLESKLMYTLLLDRMDLSEKNGWLDNSGRAFIYYTVEDMANDLCIGRDKTIKLFKELTSFGLIKRTSLMPGCPSVIYINRVGNSDSVGSEKSTRTGRKSRLTRVGNSDSNKTDMNKTELSNISPSPGGLEAEVRRQIEYDCLCDIYGKDSVEPIVFIICDTLMCCSKTIRIGGIRYPAERVHQRLRSLNSEHIGYVIEYLSHITEEIHNMSRYMLSLLFNAPSAMEHYYCVRVNSDRCNS